MPFSHLPHDVAAWHSVLAAAPLYLHQAGELTPSDRLPASGGYLVLMGELPDGKTQAAILKVAALKAMGNL